MSTKSKKRRAYTRNPMDKIKAGKPWTMHFDVDPDVAESLFEEKHGPSGGEYNKIINDALRARYTSKRKQKPVRRKAA